MNYGIRRFDDGGGVVGEGGGNGGYADIMATPVTGGAANTAGTTNSTAAPTSPSLDSVRSWFLNTPGANPNPSQADLAYYQSQGQNKFLSDVASIRAANPTLATTLDALRSNAGLSVPVTQNYVPVRGGIYNIQPGAYQPVRYTPQYDQFGQGIASLFGQGYSRYFQPPGLQGVYYFGDQPRGIDSLAGGNGTYLGPGLTPAGGGTQAVAPTTASPTTTSTTTPTTTQTKTVVPPTTSVVKPAYTGNPFNDQILQQNYQQQAALAAVKGDTSAAQTTKGQQVANIYSQIGRSGSLAPSAAEIAFWAGQNKPIDQIRQEILSSAATFANDPVYGGVGSLAKRILDQGLTNQVSTDFGAPATTNTLATTMTNNNLTVNDVASLTGVPPAAVNAYLNTTSTQTPESVVRAQFDKEADAVRQAFMNTPGANPNPSAADIGYYSQVGIDQLLKDVAAVRAANPTVAAQIDAQRAAMGLDYSEQGFGGQ